MENSNRTKCEVYARIVGYLRPIDQWNDGKAAEFCDRKLFDNVFLELKGEKNVSLNRFE